MEIGKRKQEKNQDDISLYKVFIIYTLGKYSIFFDEFPFFFPRQEYLVDLIKLHYYGKFINATHAKNDEVCWIWCTREDMGRSICLDELLLYQRLKSSIPLETIYCYPT